MEWDGCHLIDSVTRFRLNSRKAAGREIGQPRAGTTSAMCFVLTSRSNTQRGGTLLVRLRRVVYWGVENRGILRGCRKQLNGYCHGRYSIHEGYAYPHKRTGPLLILHS